MSDHDIKDDREASEEFRKDTHVDLDGLMDNLYRAATGQKIVQSSSEPDGAVDTSADRPDIGYTAEHVNFDNIAANLGLVPQATQQQKFAFQTPSADFGDLTPIIKDIATFKFSSNRQKEIQALHNSVRNQIKAIIINRVIDTTRNITSGSHKFFSVNEGGLRVEFSVLGQNHSMLAAGNFSGDECLCWNVDGNEISGYVMRRSADGSFRNISGDFVIKVTKGWKK